MQEQLTTTTSDAFKSELRSLHGQLKKSEHILLATHEGPDGDGIGAMLALSLYLLDSGKRPYPFSFDALPESLHYLPGRRSVRQDLPSGSNMEVVIGLDYGDIERLHLAPEFLDEARFITIDHHIASHPFGNLQIVYPDLSSTSEIVYWFFKYNNLPISRDIALNLLTGILVDTGGFSHITTSSRVLEVGSDLLKCGVDPAKVLRQSLDTRGEAALKIWGRALGRIREEGEIGMLYSYILREDLEEYKADFDDVAGLISLLNTAPTTRFTVLLVEYEEGIIKGSLRSEQFKGVDVSRIASALGGGGHRYASGFTFKGTIEETVEEIKRIEKGIETPDFEGSNIGKKTYDIVPPEENAV